MAGMNGWVLATVLLLPPLAIPVAVALRADVNNRLAAVQMAGTLAALMLALITFATDQSAFIDLALCAMLLAVPGTLLMAMFLERWL